MTARGTLHGMEPADLALLPADKLRRPSRREHHVLADAWFPGVTFDVDDLLPHRDPGGGRPARDP